MAENQEVFSCIYKFILGEGQEKKFEVELEKKTLNLLQEKTSNLPDWTKLAHFKCANCPLDESKHRHCPVAVNMINLIDFFNDLASCEEVDVVVETQDRKYSKRTDVQSSVSSLIGIYMASGGCPILSMLKPMVRFHLPFATIEETQYRVLSMYLLAQYFSVKHGKQPDWELKDLSRMYENIRVVNESFSKRLKSAEIKDTSVNALVILDIFANYVNFSIDGSMVEEVEYLFEAYFN